jgi:PAS domain S-box-containing protein
MHKLVKSVHYGALHAFGRTWVDLDSVVKPCCSSRQWTRALSVSDESLAKLLGAFPEIVVVLDSSGTVLWANELAQQLFGLTLASAIGRSAIDLVHPDDLEIVLRSLETVQGKEVGSPLEIRAKIGDNWRLIELIGTPVGWLEEGAVLFSIRDLTERRRFELANDDVARFRSLVHNATTIMMLISRAASVESVSGALTRMLGHDPRRSKVSLSRRSSPKVTTRRCAQPSSGRCAVRAPRNR